MTEQDNARRLLIVLKGYPRVSETFIAQELLGLQNAGLDFEIVSLRQPYDDFTHPVHAQIKAPVRYLPEQLRDEPGRLASAFFGSIRRPGFWSALRLFLTDLTRDRSTDRIRRFGQAVVLAAEAPAGGPWLYAHFAHTPASVTRYAATILGAPFSISAHAKDIWTTPDWDLAAKLGGAQWTVTCTRVGRDRLREIAPEAAVHLNYHGLDLGRFPASPAEPSGRDGSDPADPVRLLSVGRAVPKKGYDTLLAALATLPATLHWQFQHIGGGSELARLKAETDRLGLSERVIWSGPKDQTEVLEACRASDVFVLASHETTDGDRDGLPNVLVEAASQGLACVATRFSAIPELIENDRSGLLVPPEEPEVLAGALSKAMSDPALRGRLGNNAATRVRESFDFQPGIDRLKALFEVGP